MKQADLNRALDKAESFTEALLLNVVGFPKPFTAAAVLGWSLLCVYVGYWVCS